MSKHVLRAVPPTAPEPLPPEELRRLAGAHFGPAELDFVWRGWEHGESAVWRVGTADGGQPAAYLKAHRQARKYLQEVTAYRHYAPHLPNTPRLIAARDAPPRALLLTAVPGDLVERLSLAPHDERRIHFLAGRFLAALHDLEPALSDPLPVTDALALRAREGLERGRPHLAPGELAWVDERLAQATELVRSLALLRVPCHRDFTPRNWLADRTGGRIDLHVIDFEHTRPDLALLDLERLWSGAWGFPAGTGRERPDLRDAFLEGYGRDLTSDEWAALERLSALVAVTTVAWAAEHEDAPFEAHGRAVLRRLIGDS